MLINLSNHPSPAWPENQMKAACELFSLVTDLPFPQIEPGISRAEMEQLVLSYGNQCLQQIADAGPGNHAVHLMGEMVFTTALASWLLRRNVRCVASATRRITRTNGNEQISVFEFAGFRDYFIFY